MPRSIPTSVLLKVSLAWLLVACSSPSSSSRPAATKESETSTVRQSIMGGVDEHDHPAVVGVFVEMEYGARLCSGTLIAPNLVLTARHCVAHVSESVQCGLSKFGDIYPVSSFHVTTDWDGLQKAAYSLQFEGNWFDVAEVWVTKKHEVCGNDLALLELKPPGVPAFVAAPISPRLDQRLAVGEPYQAFGFGSTNDYGAGMGKRRVLGGLRVDCVGSCDPLSVKNDTEWQGERGICQGDSGGPAMDTQGRVSGVASRGGSGCSTPVYEDLTAWSVWLRQRAQRAAQDGAYPEPDWVAPPPEPRGSGAAAGAAGHSGSARPGARVGEPCSSPDDCSGDLACVQENSLTSYCAPTCSAQRPACPNDLRCHIESGACLLPGGFAQPCSRGRDCRSGVCLAAGGKQYCSATCSTRQPACPSPAICAQRRHLCILPSPEEFSSPDFTEPGIVAGACSLAEPEPKQKHSGVPWVLASLLFAFFVCRRIANIDSLGWTTAKCMSRRTMRRTQTVARPAHDGKVTA